MALPSFLSPVHGFLPSREDVRPHMDGACSPCVIHTWLPTLGITVPPPTFGCSRANVRTLVSAPSPMPAQTSAPSTTGDGFHALDGVQGLLWALGDLRREPGLSALLWVVACPSSLPINSSPLRLPSKRLSLSRPSTQFGTTGHLPLAPFSPHLWPTSHARPPQPCVTSCRERRASSLKSSHHWASAFAGACI